MTYTPQPLEAPRLAGWKLRLLAAATEFPLVATPLARAMIVAAGVPQLRATPATEPAIVRPPLPTCDRAAELPPDDAPPSDGWGSSTPDPLLETVGSFATAYRSGARTPDEVAEAFLRSAADSDRDQPPLRAFIATDAADLRSQAAASTRRFRAGTPAGPLDGVPVAVKDELDQTPYPTTAGSRRRGQSPAAADATVVARLRAAGALLVGKLNMQEVGLGITGINPHHGTPRNPYDPARITGGSSSGSAAAVGAGLCPIAVSADAGGSIRIPSALCGIVGLKPTFGRISEHGAAVLCWSIAHVGVIGTTASDVALAYATIAGVDPRDPNTAGQPPPHLRATRRRDLRGRTVGVFRPWFEDADSAVVEACDRALAEFARAGATVRPIDLPDLHLVRPVHFVTAAVEWATAFAHQSRAERRRMGADVRLTLRSARGLKAIDYVHAQRLRHRICTAFAVALDAVDVIATPTTPTTAPPVPDGASTTGESDLVTLDRMTRFVLAANLTGLPAISFPVGYDPHGLPIGMQLIGRPWTEDVLLQFAAASEQFVPRRPPRRHFRLLDLPSGKPSHHATPAGQTA